MLMRSFEPLRFAAMVLPVLLIAAAGCGQLATDPAPVEGGLVLHVREIHDFTFSRVGTPDIALFIESEREYNCANYRLDSELDVKGQEISLSIRGIRTPEICLAALGPAQFKTFLPGAEGEYSLRISHGGRTDRYTLSITREAITLQREHASFTRTAYGRFWRYPPLSFAYICDSAGAHREACDRFRGVLREQLAIEPFSFPAGGEIPYPQSESGWGREWRAEYYRYPREEEYLRAGELLRSFIAENPGVMLSVMNWQNLSFRSWLGGN